MGRTERSSFLGKWLWILFWIVVPGSVASLMTNEHIVGWIPSLKLPGQILNVFCLIVYGLILLKLSSKENDHYRTAGICCLIAAAGSGIIDCISGAAGESRWILLLTVPVLIVSLAGEYQEYMGHGEVLNGMAEELSEKWYRLWKWYVGSLVAFFCSLVVMWINSILGLMTLVAAGIGVVVVSILKLLYLYRMAKLFRGYSAEE